ILFLFFLGRQFTEVLLDDVSVVRGEFLANLLHRLLALLGGQITPAALFANILALHFAGAVCLGGAAHVGRIQGTNILRVAGHAALAAVLLTVPILLTLPLPLLLLAHLHLIHLIGAVLHVLDQLIERGDDAVLDRADLFAGVTQVEPARD